MRIDLKSLKPRCRGEGATRAVIGQLVFADRLFREKLKKRLLEYLRLFINTCSKAVYTENLQYNTTQFNSTTSPLKQKL